MKNKKTIWEEILILPSFNHRFGVFCFILLFIIVILIIFGMKKYNDPSLQLYFVNTVFQASLLMSGLIAAYFVFRQLIENRFDKFKELGEINLRAKYYARALHYWKEAYYIKPDFEMLSNLLELYLIVKDFQEFDEKIKNAKKIGLISPSLEDDEKVVYLHLEILRELFVENLGEAKEKIKKLITIIRQNDELKTRELFWNFNDMRGSDSYSKLSGESKIVSENLLNYLEKKLNKNKKKQFEDGQYD